jgi:hypothetical protein
VKQYEFIEFGSWKVKSLKVKLFHVKQLNREIKKIKFILNVSRETL